MKVTEADEASVWVEGGLELSTIGVPTVPAGGVALASAMAEFSALSVGYDTNADDVIDDVVVSNPFGSTTITPTYDP